MTLSTRARINVKPAALVLPDRLCPPPPLQRPNRPCWPTSLIYLRRRARSALLMFVGVKKGSLKFLAAQRWGLQPNPPRWQGVNLSLPPPPSTRKPAAEARSPWRQSKALNEDLLRELKKILKKGHKSGQCQVKCENRQFPPYRLLRRD